VQPFVYIRNLVLPRVVEYSLLSISGCKFSFPIDIFLQQLMNCWKVLKLGVSRLHLQLASLEIDLNIFT